ncbi:ABC transporter substrate-binding protein [Rhodococcus aerolatus]
MTRPRLPLPVRLVLAGLAVLLAGCFSAPADPAAGADRPLRVALAFPPVAGLSPFGDDALVLSRLGVTDGLTALDPAGSPVPALAARWVRQDPTSWRFTLAPDLVFHDGTPVTADAVVGALTAATAASPVPRAVRGTGLSATAEAGDVVVRTSSPDPVLPQRLSSPTLAVLAPAAYTAAGVDPVRHGTGPYVLESVRGTEGATLTAFAGYRDGPPEAPGVEARFVTDAATRASALRAGEVDVADALPIAQLPLLEAGQVQQVALPRTDSLLLTTTSPVFSDAGLRSAAAAAVDPAALAAGVFEGQADAATGLFGPAVPWAAGRAAPLPAAPAVDPGGRAVTVATYSDRAELPETLTVVAQSLTDAGFTVTQVVRSYADLEADLLAGRFDAAVASRSSLLDTGDPAAFLAADVTCGGGNNLARLCDPGIDAAVAALAGVDDVAERRVDALAVEAQVLATRAVVPLVHERARIGVGTDVTGVAADPFERSLVTAATRRR